jgi:Domain of Unknown Function (DUF1080)
MNPPLYILQLSLHYKYNGKAFNQHTMKLYALTFFIFSSLAAMAQQVQKFDLPQMLKENKLITKPGHHSKIIDSAGKQGINTEGVIWLKNRDFKDGTIDIDLKGKNVFLQSFLGIAFHAKDTATYDVVYFRPFRFRIADTATRRWSVQYMTVPDFDYSVLRKDHPGVYENSANPAPLPDDWFHATIVVKGDWITVYVNHSTTASLKVKKLNDRPGGIIGLWTSTSDGNFANLTITD